MMLLLVTSALALTLGRRVEPEPAPPEVLPPEEMAMAAPPAWDMAPGSLYDANRLAMLTGMSSSSRQVGELVTVDVDEASIGLLNASTNTSAASSTQFGVQSMFGLDLQAQNANKSLAGGISMGMTRDTTHDGAGSVSRNDTIVTKITCHVAAVLPNGNLLLVGTKDLRVNGELQSKTMRGIARPRDISSDNIVPSWRLDDFKWEDTGAGTVSDKQRVGWGQRIVDNIAP